MSENNSVPGLMKITRAAYPQGAGTPRQAAMQNMNSDSQHQANANRALAGGKRRKKKSYRGGEIIAPQFTSMPYKPTGGPGTNPNDQMKGNAERSTQMAENSKLDNLQAGGNPDWHWPCLNGGKKRTKKNNRKLRNNSIHRRRKSRKHRKSHKRNKSRKH
jgi:hypothetical protein